MSDALSRINLGRLEKLFFYFFIFFLPTQTSIHFWPFWSHIWGMRIDYLAPTIYLSDLLFITCLILRLLQVSYSKLFILLGNARVRIGIIIFCFLALMNISLSISPPIAIIRWLKVVEIILLSWYIYTSRFLYESKTIKLFLISLGLFSLIGISQFFTGHTLGFPFNILGERTFNISMPGIAKMVLDGSDYLRPYSTFGHPNSLAGFLGTSILLIYSIKVVNKVELDGVEKLLTAVILGAVMLTASLNTFLALTLLLPVFILKSNKFFKNYLYFCLIGILLVSFIQPHISVSISAPSVWERIDLARFAWQSILGEPIFGVGLNNFIVMLSKIDSGRSQWLLQPVHNIYLLVLSEVGVTGFLVFIFLVIRPFVVFMKNKQNVISLPLLFILLTGMFDHYSITLQQNLLIFGVVLGVVYAKLAK